MANSQGVYVGLWYYFYVFDKTPNEKHWPRSPTTFLHHVVPVCQLHLAGLLEYSLVYSCKQSQEFFLRELKHPSSYLQRVLFDAAHSNWTQFVKQNTQTL